MSVSDQEILIRSFANGDGKAFYRLNMAWITAHFHPEPKDEATLSDPEGTILRPGGHILLAEWDGKTVGCIAVVPMADGGYEVAKMAVAEEVRGRGVGRLLLETVREWAQTMGAVRLYLETNAKLTPAVHLYESFGFRHLPPERRPVSPYARADVFMEMVLEANS
jgi:putative acetyltransferase